MFFIYWYRHSIDKMAPEKTSVRDGEQKQVSQVKRGT